MSTSTSYLALTVFLLLVAIGALIVICLVIFVKRQVARRKTRIWRAPFTPIGQGFSKTLKKDLHRKIDFSSRVRHEPYVFTSEYQENWENYRHDKKRTFQYRMLAMKRFGQLQKVILQENSAATDLIIGHNVTQFLLNARENILKKAEAEDIKRYARLYNHARFDLKPFDLEAYQEFVRLHEVLITCASSWRNLAPRESNESHHFHEDLNRSERKHGLFASLLARPRVMGSATSSNINRNNKDVMEGEAMHLDPLGEGRRDLDGLSDHSSSSMNSMAAPLISTLLLEETGGGESHESGTVGPSTSSGALVEPSGASRPRRTHPAVDGAASSSLRASEARVYYRPGKEPLTDQGPHGVENEAAHHC